MPASSWGGRMAENSAQTQLLEGVADTFGLETAARRIEVYDNSHIQGSHALGAFIVAGPEGFEKAQYRKFNIKTAELAPGRRLCHDARGSEPPLRPDDEEETEGVPQEKWQRPDLVLIDGGPGQMAVACQVFADLGVEDVALAAISKGPDRDAGREHLIFPARNLSVWISKAPVCIICSGCAARGHRFVIGGHRKSAAPPSAPIPWTRSRASAAGRKRALLVQHFGSGQGGFRRPSLTDLSSVTGVSATLAKKIYDFFHQAGDLSGRRSKLAP